MVAAAAADDVLLVVLCSPTSPKLKSHRPYASRVRTNMRARTIKRTHREERIARPKSPPIVYVCVRDNSGSSWRKEQMGREITRASARSDRMRLSSDVAKGKERQRESESEIDETGRDRYRD